MSVQHTLDRTSLLEGEEMATAHLDTAHRGDIVGAFGTVRQHDFAPRTSWMARLLTLLAIIGPGLIVRDTAHVDSTGILNATDAT